LIFGDLAMGQNPTDGELYNLISEVDESGTGSISFKEYALHDAFIG